MKTYVIGRSALAEVAAAAAPADVPRETVSPPARRDGLPWTDEELTSLSSLRELAWTFEEIAEVLHRSPGAIRIKASRKNLVTYRWRHPHPRKRTA